MNLFCPKCGHQAEGFEKFCSGCGCLRKIELLAISPEQQQSYPGMPLWAVAFCVLGGIVVLAIVAYEISPPTQTSKSTPPTPLTCQEIHLLLDNKPIAQLSRRDLSRLRACESLVGDAK